MEIEPTAEYVLKVTAEELDTIADGLRTVQPRYDMPGNRYYKSIKQMLFVIDDTRGHLGTKEQDIRK